MRIKTPGDGLIMLPMEVKDKLKTATLPELKVLLYLSAVKEADAKEMAASLGITPGEAEAAVAFWRGAGIFEEDDAPKKAVPQSSSLYKSYDSFTIAEFLKKESFKGCCEIVGEKLEKELNKNDYNSLVYLYDYVGLPAEVIVGVAEYCVSNGKKSMQYLMKTALSMYERDGVDTYEKFEKYMEKEEKLHSETAKVKKLCGFGDRELTAKEKGFFDKWFAEWEFSFDMVKLSYEKTVDSLGKISLSYMNGMLKRWYEAGIRTPEDAMTKNAKPGKGDGSVAGYEDGDEFLEAALKKGME